MPPSPFSALPPLHISDASPKAISGRTSYLRVRLEFLRYPQLIPCFFNSNVVRSSTRFYPRFNLAMDRSPGFGSITYDLIRPVQARFHFGSVPYLVLNLAIYNNSLDRSTKSTISHLNVLYLLVNIGFQVLFHSPPGVLFTFPSRYYSTIDHQVVFSLMGWSPLLHTRFHVPRITLDPTMLFPLSYTGLSPSMVCFSKTFLLDS